MALQFSCILSGFLRPDAGKLISPSSNFLGRTDEIQYRPIRYLKARKGLCLYASHSEDGDGGEHQTNRPPTPLLDTINNPIHMKKLSFKELKQLADELRSDMIFNVYKTGGHLGSSLSVVELTIALHYVFNTPDDKIIWDGIHLTYTHEILTGRMDRMSNIRQINGLSGFPKQSESDHDIFGAGHSSTCISAGLGMAVGRDIKGGTNNVIAVIGDGAMTISQAYEAVKNVGYLDTDMIIILNDNKPISKPTASFDGTIPPVDDLSSAFNILQSNWPLKEPREVAKEDTKQIGGSMHEIASKVDEYSRDTINIKYSSMFEELGFFYIGPVDGHNIEELVTILKEVKSMRSTGPIFIHVVTEKGRGYPYGESTSDKYIGPVTENNTEDLVTILKEVKRIGPVLIHVVTGKRRGYPNPENTAGKYQATGKQFIESAPTKAYADYFAEALIAEAEVDKNIMAIRAEIGCGTGLNCFFRRFPSRCFDVGISEQHAVTFAAGLATEGLKPFCAIYPSFLQRAYDKVIHDVDLQKLPVRFAMGRAGLVGEYGPMHSGSFDVTYMACLPNMVVMAPANEAELVHMVATAAAINDRPSCFLYPRGNGIGVPLPLGNKGIPLEVGKGRICVEGERLALLGYGTAVQSCLAAASLVSLYGLNLTVADARFCKPLDRSLIRSLAKSHEVLITVEEGSIGGFGSHVAHFMATDGLLDDNIKWRPLVLPDRYFNHEAPANQLAEAGLTPSHIAATVFNILGMTREALEIMS